MIIRSSALLLAISVLSIRATAATQQQRSPAESSAIAKDAYIYTFAMTESYQTWHSQAVDKNSGAYVGGFNVYWHYSEPFTPTNKDIVTPMASHRNTGVVSRAAALAFASSTSESLVDGGGAAALSF